MKKYATLLDQRKIFIATISTSSKGVAARHRINGAAGCGSGPIGITRLITGCISIKNWTPG